MCCHIFLTRFVIRQENVIADAEEEYSGTRDKLESIAKEAKEIRETEVEPLRKKVSQFIEESNHDE